MSHHVNHKIFENQTALFIDFKNFEQKVQLLAKEMNLDLNQYEIDHLALRVNTEESAKNWLALLLKYGKVLSDNIINGRVIYLIQLEQPLSFSKQWVEIVELPFPKNKHYPYEGWEHIEIVVPFLPNEKNVDWIARVKSLFLRNKQNNLAVKVSEPKGSGEKLVNLSVAVSFLDKTDNPVCVKAHPYSIKQIIEEV